MSSFYQSAMAVFASKGPAGLTLNTDTASSQYKDAQLQAQRMTVSFFKFN